MSIFKKIVSVFNDLTDHTVMADDTVLESIPTKKNFLTKEFEENLSAFYDQLPAPMKHNVYHDDYGEGAVVAAYSNSGEFVIEVQFATGTKKKFLPKYQAKSLEIINSDF